jgi:protein TonB
VDAVPDVPIDPVASDDSTPASYSDVSAAVAASGATGGEEKNEEGSRGRAYVAPDVRADYLFKPDPKYPSLSLRLREQGLVKLRVHITEEGRAGEGTLHTSSGYERLDKSAIDSVKNHWRFRPAQRRGEPVASWEVVPVRFELQG